MPQSPSGQALQRGPECLAVTAQPVLALRNLSLLNGSNQDACLLQLPELLGEDLVSNALNGPAKLPEAPRSVFQFEKNKRLPLPSDDVDRGLHGTLFNAHAGSLSLPTHKFVRSCQTAGGSL